MPQDFILFDIGSRGMTAAHWHKVAKDVHVIGFEPDPAECKRLNWQTKSSPFKSEEHFAVALSGADGDRTFYVTRDPACSSLYKPNKKWFEHDNGDPDRADVIETRNIYTRSLRSFCNEQVRWPDFIKIDAQGAEGEILNGYTFLAGAYGVEVEVLALPLYSGIEHTSFIVQAILNLHGFRPWAIQPMYWMVRGRRRIAYMNMLYLNEAKLESPDMEIVFDVYSEWLL